MDPALYKAATRGDAERLRQLVAADAAIINSKTPQLDTALHLAALHGHAEFAGEVLDTSGGLLAAKNADGDTPLNLAARARRPDVAELLVAHAMALPMDESNPLLVANNAGNNPLHEAVRRRRVAAALALLDAEPSLGHNLNDWKESPLDMAAREGLVAVVQKIVEHIWVDDKYVPAGGGSALHHAALGGYTRIVEILLAKHPGLVELRDDKDNNALHYAAQKNNQQLVELLLMQKTALAYERNGQGQSPLAAARRRMVDGAGRNAFHVAVASGKTGALRRLLRAVRPAELLNRADGGGNTPLHFAAEMRHVQSGLLLLGDRRVDPCACNHDGHTARSLLEIKSVNGATMHGHVVNNSAAGAAGGGGGDTAHSVVDMKSPKPNDDMDAYEMYLWQQLKRKEATRCRKHQLPPVTVAGDRRTSSHKYFERSVETYILVATLIATVTVTFAATFTMPGGYKQDSGIAVHGHNTAFNIFVISNTVAMCSSLVVVFCFIW
ncbi:hypothetical protein ACP4OV_026656 [Aristida adscensionis]